MCGCTRIPGCYWYEVVGLGCLGGLGGEMRDAVCLWVGHVEGAGLRGLIWGQRGRKRGVCESAVGLGDGVLG